MGAAWSIAFQITSGKLMVLYSPCYQNFRPVLVLTRYLFPGPICEYAAALPAEVQEQQHRTDGTFPRTESVLLDKEPKAGAVTHAVKVRIRAGLLTIASL